MGSSGYIQEYIRTIKSKEEGIWEDLEEGNGRRKCSN